jgi:hypothetical protein
VLDLDAPSVAEGTSGQSSLTFTVSLSHPSALPVSVEWNTDDGTASAGTDYAAASGTVTFAPLDVSESVVVDVFGDVTYERDETVVLELSNPTNAPLGRTGRVGTVVNDDAAPVVSIGDASIVEGAAGVTTLSLTVSLSAASGVDASVDFSTADGTATAGGDFVGSTGTVDVLAGETSAAVEVQVTGDGRYEPDETFTVDLSAPVDATLGDGSAQATILNDDPRKTTITVRVTIGRESVTAKGLLEPTRSGHRVRVTLFRRLDGAYVRVAARTVTVKRLRDRDGDGKTDGAYAATFLRPRAGGGYRFVARFAGSAGYTSSTKSKRFPLAPR